VKRTEDESEKVNVGRNVTVSAQILEYPRPHCEMAASASLTLEESELKNIFILASGV